MVSECGDICSKEWSHRLHLQGDVQSGLPHRGSVERWRLIETFAGDGVDWATLSVVGGDNVNDNDLGVAIFSCPAVFRVPRPVQYFACKPQREV